MNGKMNGELTMTRLGIILVLLGASTSLHVRCPQSSLAQMPVLVEYAVWRGWHQALIYSGDLMPRCSWAVVHLVKSLSFNGIAAAIDVCKSCAAKSRLGVVILSPTLRRNYTYRLSNTVNEIITTGLNTASYDWLLMAKTEYEINLINNVLNVTAIRFDQNIIVAYSSFLEKSAAKLMWFNGRNLYQTNNNKLKYYRLKNRRMHEGNKGYQSDQRDDCIKNEITRNSCSISFTYKNLSKNSQILKIGKKTPLFRLRVNNTNKSKHFQMLNATAFSLKRQFVLWSKSLNVNVGNHIGKIHVVQYFKVRANSTLYASYLGAWLEGRSLSLVQMPYTVEERNFLGEEFLVGRSNFSGDGVMGMDDERPESPALDDLLDFLIIRLNITSVTRYYSKLGFRTYEGVWTGLLGALMDSSVDIALEPVTALTSRYQDMDFVFPIAETMCNIYIRHKETSAVRDIFLAPFSSRLVVCVVAAAVIAALTVGFMSRVATRIAIGNKERTMSCTEALLWSIGILCQQGAQWTPPTPAASIVLIVCLLFAVVTYNSYAAFITSVLSVRVPSVATVSDVLDSSNFKIGYIRNGADQMYLMSTKDVQLNAFYIRGYSEAENLVSSAEEGLTRAARQDYAFFTGQLAARSTLSKFSQARGRCALRELSVPSTRAQLSFPLSRRSPYARPILISLLQFRSSGALARLEAALVPALPQCASPSGFASARAADVRSALLLLLVGVFAALLIGAVEFCWNKRMRLKKLLTFCYRRILSFY